MVPDTSRRRIQTRIVHEITIRAHQSRAQFLSKVMKILVLSTNSIRNGGVVRLGELFPAATKQRLCAKNGSFDLFLHATLPFGEIDTTISQIIGQLSDLFLRIRDQLIHALTNSVT